MNKILITSVNGKTGKTTFMKHLISLIDDIELRSAESIDSHCEIEGSKEYPSDMVLQAIEDTIDSETDACLDAGSSCKEALQDGLENGWVDLSEFTSIICPVVNNSDQDKIDSLSYIKSLIELGDADPDSVIIVYNRMSVKDVKAIEFIFGDFEKELYDLGVSKFVTIKENDVFKSLDDLDLTLAEFNTLDTDFKKIKKEAATIEERKTAGKLVMARRFAKTLTAQYLDLIELVIS